MRYVLGIDAGGTKTVGVLADETGLIVGESRSTGANLQTHGELEVEKVFHQVMEGLTAQHQPDAVCLGIAGVDRPDDEALIRNVLRRLGHRERALIVNDGVIALVAGAHERFGIVILAGTGSIAFGVNREGAQARAGGYGHLLADEGSAYWLGRQVMRAAVRGADGRGPKTILQDLLFEALKISSIGELVPLVYEKGMPRTEIAGLAGLVQKAHDQDDPVAVEVLQSAAVELCLAARAVALRLAFRESFTVVLAGGVFRACPTLPRLMERTLQVPGASLKVLDVEPAEGAMRLAIDLLKEPRAGAGSPSA